MDNEEAKAWLRGELSMTNIISQYPRETWMIRTEQADAAKLQQAYWIAKAHKEGLLDEALMTDSQFRATLDWWMYSDPFQCDDDTHDILHDLLDGEAKKRGFEHSWVEAFHRFEKPKEATCPKQAKS